MADDAVPYRSLYRRFRPQRFGEVRGQDHVVRALSNAVRDGKVGHAYLFSGPRGTGKTSTARILAKALNCPNMKDGEPCGVCPSCVAVEQGTSLDVHELDAASNNGVDAMRDLVSRAALGTPGRQKVYIVDEVHMLSTAASNALLKTLEEPPGHVVFVLATTDPQKVLPTIRSRTQHFEFRLLGADTLTGLLAEVNEEAGLGVAPEAIELVVRRGKGSARDALSVLDQVAAAGDVDDEAPATEELAEALCERDAGAALVAVAEACAAGRDPRRLAADLVDHLRNAFLLTQAPNLVPLPDEARARLAEQAHRMGPAALVRGIETLGQAQVDMRDALDPRITLEAALVRLARPDADTSPAAIVERLERLERVAVLPAPHQLVPPAAAPAPAPHHQAGPPPPRRQEPPPPRADDAPPHREAPPPWDDAPPPDEDPIPARQGPPPGRRPGPPPPGGRRPPPPPPPARSQEAAARPAPRPAPPPPGTGALPTRDALTKAWGDTVLRGLSLKAKARFGAGRFAAVEDGAAVFAVPNAHVRGRCEEVRAEVEEALAAHFGARVPLRLVVDGPAGGGPAQPAVDPAADDAGIDLDDVVEGEPPGQPPAVTSPEERLKQAFPGAEEVPT
ncbi:MAG TPA: DNA polymerase III subunit gamma/tau [Acidimicrobiales bacterium]|nr:DNA polymerase III subunit gamma/tau [Acidimicrobiales bacterium]